MARIYCKRCGDSGIKLKFNKNLLLRAQHATQTSTTRLTVSYLLIIMLMSIGFSLIFYHTSSQELGRQLPSPDNYELSGADDEGSGRDLVIDDFFSRRIAEGRESLQTSLLLLNLSALLLGSVLSYILARKTLQPIEQNMEAQTQFVSDASHELRTPLTSLRTTNEVALRRDSLSKKEVKDLLDNNVQDVIKLQNLTDNLLRLAQQDANSMDRSLVSLQDVASDAMNVVMNRALDKKISIDDTVPAVTVMANRLSLTQVLIILLDNAIKYSPAGTSVYMTGGRQDNNGYISVRDEGCGISDSDQQHIFDRFYRADQSRNKAQDDGFGIGLALADKIIKHHHGEISIVSDLNKGTKFTIKLPLK